MASNRQLERIMGGLIMTVVTIMVATISARAQQGGFPVEEASIADIQVLSPDKKKYVAVTGDVEVNLPHPLPIRMMFWAGPGSDPDVIKVASAYEAATHHRVPPPAFGPVPADLRSSRQAGQ